MTDRMRTIEYAADGIAVADHNADKFARGFLKGDETYCKVSTENVITAVRVLVHERRYPHDKVAFLFNGKHLYPNKDGRMPDWPVGFCDYQDRMLDCLLSPPPDSDLPL